MSGAQATSGGSPAAGAADPSMEDILASIRRILSEEDPAAAAASAVETAEDVLILDHTMLVSEGASPAASAPLAVAFEPEAVEPEPVEPEPMPTAVASPLSGLGLAELGLPFVGVTALGEPNVGPPMEAVADEGEPPHEPAPYGTALIPPVLAAVADQVAADNDHDVRSAVMMNDLPSEAGGLVADQTANAAAGAVSDLFRVLASDRTTRVSRDGPTIADLVREELRPLLAGWLDTNLPPLVERLVRAEIDRVVAKAAL